LPVNADFLISVAAIVITLGLLGDLIMKRQPLPASLVLILLGYLLGTISFHGVLRLIFPGTNTPLLPLPVSPFLTIAPLFAILALMMILFYGGLELKMSSFLKEIPRILIQVNIYVLAGIFSIAVLTIFLLHWDFWSSLLMGSIIGGETTAAVVVPLTKLVKMSQKTKTFLILESTINSIYSVVFFFAFLRVIQGEALGILGILTKIGEAVFVGALVGALFAYIWRWISPSLKNFEFSYVVVLLFVFVAYILADFTGGGLVSSLVFGFMAFRVRNRTRNARMEEMVLNNPTNNNDDWLVERYRVDEIPLVRNGSDSNTDYLKRIHNEMTFVMKTFFFVLMGLLLTQIPRSIIYLTLLYGGIFTLTMFGIRFVASRISTFRSSMSEDKNLILFTMAQGLTPAVLAVSTFSFGLSYAPIILALTLAVILYTNVITIGAPIMGRMGRKKRVALQV
jgi:cell volume regulation protein A